MRRWLFGDSQRRLEPRLAAVLCYLLGVFSGIIVLRLERSDRFVRFHALQSMLYCSLVAVLWLALMLAGIEFAGGLLALLSLLGWLYLMLRAARGEWFQIPALGWLAERAA